MGTGRLEAFSDGVIAVAITLLALQIDVPADRPGHSLAHALLTDWPHYAAYAVSFLTIGIIWVNHHAMISRLRETDHVIMILNLLLLMTIAILPCATALLASYLIAPDGHDGAAAVYAGSFLLMAIAFGALNRHVLMRKAHLLRENLSLPQRRGILRASVAGTVPYVAATGLAFVSPYITLAICGLLAVYYALPIASRRGLVRS